MIKTITALDLLGALNVSFEVLNPNIKLMQEIKAAANDFLHTEAGKQILSDNDGEFRFADFVEHCPNDICKAHGFYIASITVSPLVLDGTRQLLDAEEGIR